MGLGLATTAQLASLLTEALDEIAPKDGLPLWDSRLAGGDLVPPSPFPEGRKVGRSRNLDGKPSTVQTPAWHRGQTRLGGGELTGTLVSSHAYLKRHTVEYCLPTRITTLATNTTLAGSTRYDTAPFTVYIPEIAERTFESVRLVATYRSEWGASNSSIAWLIGAKVGTGPTVDFLRSPTVQSTANRNIGDEVDSDITPQFNQDFGTGGSQTIVASFECASTLAANINQITFKVVITYAFDPFAATTRLRTIRIPLQSMAGALTLVQQEFGIDGVNPVATKQIPALDTTLVEQSKVFRNLTLEFWGHDGNNAAGAAVTPSIQIDAAAEVPRATIDETLATYMLWRDALDLTGLDTSIAHKVSARADATGRMPAIGGFVIATFEYDHAATVTANLATYEALVPLINSSGNDGGPSTSAAVDLSGTVSGTTGGGASRLSGSFSIQEPGTPTLIQSAVFAMMDVGGSGGAASIGVKFPWQAAARIYTQTTTSAGSTPTITRLDGTGLVLARGDNKISVDFTGTRGVRFAYAIVNYTAGVRVDVDNGNQPINYAGHSYDTALGPAGFSITREAYGQRPPILGSAYKINAAFIDANIRSSQLSVSEAFLVETFAGEVDGGGNWAMAHNNAGASIQTLMSNRQIFSFTRSVNRDSLSAGKIDVTQRRRYIAQNNQLFSGLASWSWWITYHQHQFAIAASVVIDGQPAAAGKPVKIFAYAAPTSVLPDNLTAALDAAELVTTVTTDASGAFSALVPDNTRSYFASYDNDGRAGRSLLGTPV